MSRSTTAPSLSLPESAPAAARAASACCASCAPARSTCSCPTARSALRQRRRASSRAARCGCATGTSAPPRCAAATSALPKASSTGLELARPGGTAEGLHRQPRRGRIRHLRQLVGLAAVPRQASAQPQLAPRQPQEHPRPLRPGQSVLQAVAGRDDELLRPPGSRATRAATWRDAQWAKVRRALDECRVQPGQRVLEIGCGWGGLAEYATRHFDAHVTGVTLSTEQLAFAQQRLRTQGLDHKAELRLQDYRDLERRALRRHRLDRDVRSRRPQVLARLLRASCSSCSSRAAAPASRASPSATTCSSATSIPPTSSSSTSSPAACCPARRPSANRRARAGLRIVNELSFGLDYAETLRRWRVRFLAQEAAVRRLRFDARFMRIWEFYLAYCEAAFATGNTDVMQFTLQRD